MAKETFNNLHKEKQQKILQVLKAEFKDKPFHEVHIKGIVEELGIARGSFYQYFENLEDSYFTLLSEETTDIHSIFLSTLEEAQHDLFLALDHYGKKIAKIIFDENYGLYKHRFLYWTQDLDAGWRRFQSNEKNKNQVHEKILNISPKNHSEEMNFVKAVIHSLIQRIFLESWSKEEFLTHYAQQVSWMKKGVPHHVLD